MPTKTESPTRKVTVTLPATLVAQLDDCIPSRQRSAFIAYAIREQLAIVEQADALEASAGTWRDADYPDVATEAEMDRWLAELRGPAPKCPPIC